MPVGTTAAILLGIGAAGAGVAFSKSMTPKIPDASPMPLPQPPSVDAATTAAEGIVKSRRTEGSQTVYTSPLGIGGQADITKKTLLGQ